MTYEQIDTVIFNHHYLKKKEREREKETVIDQQIHLLPMIISLRHPGQYDIIISMISIRGIYPSIRLKSIAFSFGHKKTYYHAVKQLDNKGLM